MDTLNTTQAAEVPKVPPKTVEDLIRDGATTAAKIGRAWVMMTAHVMKFREDQVIQQTATRHGLPAPMLARVTKRNR